jgi:hypothetical protein
MLATSVPQLASSDMHGATWQVLFDKYQQVGNSVGTNQPGGIGKLAKN